MSVVKFHDYLSAPNLIKIAQKYFLNIAEPRKRVARKFDLLSFLMSGIAIFFLKFDSLLSFSEDNENTRHNLENIFGILDVPSDTHFRKIVDKIETNKLEGIFKYYFNLVKEKEVLEKYYIFDKYLPVAIDGTGFFQSNEVHCEKCLEKKSKNGKLSYEHQALPAVIINPYQKEVFPIGIEFIEKQDGETKNDCERNASKRLVKKLHSTYPDEKFIIVEDSLSSNVPHVCELILNKMSFMLGIKPGDHKKFFEKLFEIEQGGMIMKHEIFEEDNKEKRSWEFKFKNCMNLCQDDKKEEVYVNYFEVIEKIYNKKNKEEKTIKFSWITAFPITKQNIFELMKIGRARWMIENETFNTLKNQGYNFEHNYGHGLKYLTNNMCIFLFVAFLIDQIQQHCCKLFQILRNTFIAKKKVWDILRYHFISKLHHSLYDIYIEVASLSSKNRISLGIESLDFDSC